MTVRFIVCVVDTDAVSRKSNKFLAAIHPLPLKLCEN